MKLALTLAFVAMTSTNVFADPAGDLLDHLSKLNRTEFKSLQGHLFLDWAQFDENDPSFVVFIGNRRYDAKLDDGRGTTEKAMKCPKDNPFDSKPETGCKVTFDGQYLVEDDGGKMEVSTTIWNVQF